VNYWVNYLSGCYVDNWRVIRWVNEKVFESIIKSISEWTSSNSLFHCYQTAIRIPHITMDLTFAIIYLQLA